MASNFLKRLFGDTSEKELHKIKGTVQAVLDLEKKYEKMSDEELKEQTPALKARLAAGETLDQILPDAFAVCREAAWRVLGMKHFPVQVQGGIILHQGRIAEMRTGEGKTLVSTLPAYLNALTGEGVHIVTVNDYLAKRDSDWMGKVHRFLGLTVGCIVHDLDNDERREAYACDITYGTNNEMGFDYLRDNMAIYKSEMVQRGHVFAIVDEIDSILIDEARTPLIISGRGDESTDLYERANRFALTLKPLKMAEVDEKQSQDDIDADYIIDEKARTATITPRGVTKAEQYFKIENLTDPENMTLVHHIDQAIKAHGVMHRDIDYVVKDGEIIIVDEFTGRLMMGRRYSEGLHQAIEAKEHVKVMRENRTVATITFQNYFRLYKKLSGMTGTALTEEDEFRQIYNLDVIAIPTNRPMIRKDHEDSVYKTESGKLQAVIKRIQECNAKGQPVLVGTVSIEKSEILSALLKKQGIKHQVLNAKQHDKEATIVAQAGKPGAVTIATNMAGRGTDIMLGGNPEAMAKDDLIKQGYSDDIINEATGYANTTHKEVLEARELYRKRLEFHKEATKEDADKVRAAGGLFILGTERHESRRIDNQLRGRAGRQGDPGESIFYLSLEDDLLRLFGGERIKALMDTLKLEDDLPIEYKMMTKTIENAQRRMEGRNFQSRKHTLEYDDVMNRQREIIYEQRRKVLDGEDISAQVSTMIDQWIDSEVRDAAAGAEHLDLIHARSLTDRFNKVFLLPGELVFHKENVEQNTAAEIAEDLKRRAHRTYERREARFGPQIMREVERVVMLRVVDEKWMDQIDAMHELRRNVSLNAYAQVNPIVEYKRQGFEMFDAMINEIRENTAKRIFLISIGAEAPRRQKVANVTGTSGDGSVSQTVRKGKKPGRNDPCPCGSGKKYKHCCGKNG